MDKYLFKVLDRAPGGFVYKMLRKKNIVLNGKKASGKEILKERDSVKFFLSDETFAKFASAVPETCCGEGEEKLLNAPGERLVPAANSVVDKDAVGDGENAKRKAANRIEAAKKVGLEIVYEDEDILVINKPAGLLSQKASAGDDSANDRIIAYLLESGQLSEAELRTFHPSICNRLDRNTSGLLIAGKTMRGLQETARQLKDRSAKKFYHAMVWGRVTEPQRMCGYLVKDHRTNQVRVRPENSGTKSEPFQRREHCVGTKPDSTRMNVLYVGTKPDSTRKNGRDVGTEQDSARKNRRDAGMKDSGEVRIETEYVPLAHYGEVTLLEVHLITGRSHQIRAHLAAVVDLILGDANFGDAALNRSLFQATGIRSQLLHACRIELSDGRIMEADDPKEFFRVEKWLCRPD